MYKADKKFMAMIEEFIPEEQRMKMTFMDICVNIFLSFIIVLNFRRGILSYPHLKDFKF